MQTKLFTLWALILLSFQSFAQQSAEDYIKAGIEFHDQGKYKQAIVQYEKALEVEPNNSMAFYEIAFSYYAQENYTKAIEHCDKVLGINKGSLFSATILKASAINANGNIKGSINLVENARKQFGNHYQLMYNLAVDYTTIGELDKAEQSLKLGLENNPIHPGSHYILAVIHHKKNNVSQTLMATMMFLMLEDNTVRAEKGYEILMERIGGNVKKDANKPNERTIYINQNDDNRFSTSHLTISVLAMMDSSVTRELNKEGINISENIFTMKCSQFFTALQSVKTDKKAKETGKLKKKNKDNNSSDIWTELYMPFYKALHESDHMEAFAFFIRRNGDEEARQWIKENESKMNNFATWVNNYML